MAKNPPRRGGWPVGMDRPDPRGPMQFPKRPLDVIKKPDGKGLLDGGTNGGAVNIRKASYNGDLISGFTAAPESYLIFEARGVPDTEVVNVIASKEVRLTTGEQYTLGLEWGIQNQLFRAAVDIVNGTVICLAANSLKVFANVIPRMPNPIGEPIVPVDTVITAAAAYGSRAGHAPPQLTVKVPDGDSYRVSVPAFARGVYLMSPTADMHFVLVQEDVEGNSLSHHPYDVGVLVSPLRTPLLNQCARLFLSAAEDGSIPSDTTLHYVFDLAL